jgi:hypothetical protein
MCGNCEQRGDAWEELWEQHLEHLTKKMGMNSKDIWQRKWDKFKEHVWEKHREYGLQYCEDMGEKNP